MANFGEKELKAHIKSGAFYPIYLICGDEDYLKRDAVSRARKAVIQDESLKDFCHCVIHEADVKSAKEELLKRPT